VINLNKKNNHKKFKVLDEEIHSMGEGAIGTITKDPEEVGYWDKKHEVNDDLKKMMAKWYKK
jgi:hypothetical protein